jgi:hypothetical protein
MTEKKKRLLVASLFYVLAFAVFMVGALASWHAYEMVTSPRNCWMWSDCCYGECVCGSPPLPLWASLQYFVINLAAVILMMLFVILGASYYKCGRFQCPEEKEEYVEAEWWGE